MTLNEIQSVLCQNQELIDKLNEKIKKQHEKLKMQVQLIKKTKEYIYYMEDQESERKRITLVTTDAYQDFLNEKEKLDILKEQLKIELNKCSIKDFEQINRCFSCEHLYYENIKGEKTCIKCGYNKDEFDHKHSNAGKLNLSYLIIELSHYYNINKKNYETLPNLFKNESLDHLINLTAQAREINPDITNEELEKKLEVLIAKMNIGLINQMYKSEESMTPEVRKNYHTYRKILINNQKQK